MGAVDVLLSQHRRSFAVTEVAWGRPDQLGDLVGVLKLRAIDLGDQVGIAEEDFGGGFDDARFARTGWSEKDQRADWAARMRQTGEINLIRDR